MFLANDFIIEIPLKNSKNHMRNFIE
jgi:hypothetical protein